jgi:hypothetical protein
MSKLANRVKETTRTVGTGALDLDGAVSGFRSFVDGIGTGNACYYRIAGVDEWEVGIGNVTSGSPDTLSRDTILSSSNSNAVVSLSDGTKDVLVTLPAAGIPTLLGQITASSSSFVDFTGLISGAYDRYFFDLINIRPSNNSVSLGLRFGTGAGPSWDTGNNYAYSAWRSDQAGSNGYRALASTAYIELKYQVDSSTTRTGFCGTLNLFNPGSAALEKALSWQGWSAAGTGQFVTTTGAGSYLSTTAITGVRFFMSGGTVASGIFRMFGMPRF